MSEVLLACGDRAQRGAVRRRAGDALPHAERVVPSRLPHVALGEEHNGGLIIRSEAPHLLELARRFRQISLHEKNAAERAARLGVARSELDGALEQRLRAGKVAAGL